MKRRSSPKMTREMAAHIKFLIKERGLYQHQCAALLELNQGRISELMTGRVYPDVMPAQGPFPV